MIQKFKSTITALVVAISFVAGSAMIGQPLPAADTSSPVASQDLNEAESEKVQSAETPVAEPLVQLKGRVGLSMPYYSFGSLLPRTRGS